MSCLAFLPNLCREGKVDFEGLASALCWLNMQMGLRQIT
jgi:hypothetical protein